MTCEVSDFGPFHPSLGPFLAVSCFFFLFLGGGGGGGEGRAKLMRPVKIEFLKFFALPKYGAPGKW